MRLCARIIRIQITLENLIGSYKSGEPRSIPNSKKKPNPDLKIEFYNMDCSICIQPCLRNQMAVGDLIHTHCNHIFHSNCMDHWNYSSQASAANCPNCRTELIAFFIDETDNARIIEANTFIPNGSQIQ